MSDSLPITVEPRPPLPSDDGEARGFYQYCVDWLVLFRSDVFNTLIAPFWWFLTIRVGSPPSPAPPTPFLTPASTPTPSPTPAPTPAPTPSSPPDKKACCLCNLRYLNIGLIILYTTLFAIPITMFFLGVSLLLLFFLLVLRILQLIGRRRNYDTLTIYKNLVRTWLLIIPIMSLLGLGLSFPFAKFTPLKHVIPAKKPLTRWIAILTPMCGLCSFSSALYLIIITVFERLAKYGIKRNAGQAIAEIIDCFIFRWATNVLIKKIPSLKQHEILGLATTDWMDKSVRFVIIYNHIIILIRAIVFLIKYTVLSFIEGKNSRKSKFRKYIHVRYVLYVANGMMASICFVMSSSMMLFLWIAYFGSNLDLKSAKIRSAYEFGRWTFISLLIFSILWLVKNFILLIWDAHTVYDRLHNQILKSSEQLYFLGILGSLKSNFFKLKLHAKDIEIRHRSYLDVLCSSRGLSIIEKKLYRYCKMVLLFFLRPDGLSGVRMIVQYDLLLTQYHRDSTFLDNIERAAQYFFVAKPYLEEETYISDILQTFVPIDRLRWRKLLLGEKINLEPDEKSKGSHAKTQSGQVGVAPKSRENGKRTNVDNGENKEVVVHTDQGSSAKINEEGGTQENQGKQKNTTNDREWKTDLNSFLEKLDNIKKENYTLGKAKQEDNTNPDIPFSFTDFRTWVERAHSHCVNMANTLSSAKELEDCLNKIISCLLVGAIFIMWLLVTGLATTKVLVLVASPLVAASFIFGDTCKTFFQGIIYVFVIHPFDVGDLCVIDDKMMEVRSIGVWTTAFTTVDKVGSGKDLVVHSNTALASKSIINYKTKFDWSDRVEFNLGRMKMVDNGNKKEKIIYFFTDHLNKLVSKQEALGSLVNEKEDEHRNNRLARDPIVSVLAKEESITLVIRLEYKVENTENWTYSECLWRKDDFKGYFNVYLQDVIRIFKAQYAEQDTNELQSKTEFNVQPKASSSSQYNAIGVREHAESKFIYLKALKKEAIRFEERGGEIHLTIQNSVCCREQKVDLVHKDLSDWCSRDMAGVGHILIFMRKLSEICVKDGTSELYGFIDPIYISQMYDFNNEERSNYLLQAFSCNRKKNINRLFFAPCHEKLHWMLAAIIPQNRTVYWLNPLGEENRIPSFAQKIINEGIEKFTEIYSKEINVEKDDAIEWVKLKCPRQPDNKVCGYYVCQYMQQIIDSKESSISTKFFGDIETYSQTKIDELRESWAAYVLENREVADKEQEAKDDLKI